MIKECIKSQKKIYKILKPIIDFVRQIGHTVRGYLRKLITFNPNFKKLCAYKNCATAERCFAVANGRS